jgi:hypothetical protein
MGYSRDDKADHLLYRTYWGLCLNDILYKQGFAVNEANKKVLHDFHKRVLGYKTISEESEEILSRFISEVVLFWGERGIFVRTSRRQPRWIEWMSLHDIWDLL